MWGVLLVLVVLVVTGLKQSLLLVWLDLDWSLTKLSSGLSRTNQNCPKLLFLKQREICSKKMEQCYGKSFKTRKCWFYIMDSHGDLAIIQSFFGIRLKILTSFKSELKGVKKRPRLLFYTFLKLYKTWVFSVKLKKEEKL